MPYGNPGWLPQSLAMNAVINGDCSVCQNKAVNTDTALAGTSSATQYPDVDLWAVGWVTLGAGFSFNSSQRSDHPLLGSRGFCKSIEVTGAASAAGANAQFSLTTWVEGSIFAGLAGFPCVLSFQIKSPKTGTHCVVVRGAGGTFIAEFQVFTANAWEQKFIPITFDFNLAGFGYSAGIGLNITWPLVAGANAQTGAIGWNAGATLKTTGNQQNLLDTIGNVFRITDVNLNIGVSGLTFARLPFYQQLRNCQRYWFSTFPYGTTPAQNTGILNGEFQFIATKAGALAENSQTFYLPVEMQNNGSAVTLFNPNANNAEIRDTVAGADCSASVAVGIPKCVRLSCTGNVATVVGNTLAVNLTMNNRF